MSSIDDSKPVYEWEAAQIGHARKTQRHKVEPERVELYVKSSGDPNPMFQGGAEAGAMPIAMVTRVAPHNRRTIMVENGFEHPVRPTPFARWQCQLFAPMKPGDVITSEAKVGDKFEKRGRKYIVWEVVAHNQRGEKVAEWRTTNCWDGAKPEDKTR